MIKITEMIIIYLPFIFRGNFQGMAVFPFVFIRYKSMKRDKRLINHEKIHLRQQIELLWIFFFLLYISEYLFKWVKYGNAHQAYKNISFEREAYNNEHNLNYLKKKKFWSFTRYLTK